MLAGLACLVAWACFIPDTASATEAPIAAYSFDEGSGTVAHDLYGNHDGELETGEGHGPAEWDKQGRFGGSLYFPGEGYQCVNIPQSPDLELQESFTLETWVMPKGSGENEPLIFKEAPTFESHTGYALYLGFESSGKVDGFVEEPGFEKQKVTSEKLPTGKWTHLALSFDGEQVRLYVNDNLVDTTAAEGPQASKGPLKFGCAEVYGQDFEGHLDEVRIYDRAISGEEVTRDMTNALQTPPVSQQPVAEFSFDENEGTVAHDLAGGRDATIEGATWTPRGKYGSALEFDGEEDRVSIPAGPGLHVEEEFTLEAWVRPGAENGKYAPLVSKVATGSEVEPFFLYEGSWISDQPYGGLEAEAEGETFSHADDPLSQNAWSHLALTFDGAKTRLYVDGGLVDEDAGSEPTVSEGEIVFGADESGNFFKGRIDEVRIYNRALNAGEVQADREAPIQTPKQTPVAAFAFDEGEGETAEDVTGDGHTATLEGASWTTHGRYGGGVEFDASEEDKLTIPDSSELDFTEEFTLEAWVRPSPSNGNYGPLITRQTTGKDDQPYFLYEGSWVTDQPYGGVEGNAPGEAFSHADDPLPQNAWSHLALTFDGAETRLYVNGELVDEDAGSPPGASNGNLQIGAADEVDSYFSGRIDEVRIYNRALEPAEVAADESAPIQTPQQGPIAAYSFDEGEGTTVEDLTGAGHTATIEGAEWSNRGRYGGALEFDGEEDCASTPVTEDLQFSEEFTLEAWVRPEGSGEKSLPAISMNDEESKGEEQQFAYELFAGQDQVPKGWVRKGSESGYDGVYGEEPLPEKAWSHVTLTDNGSVIRIYVDGVLGDEENSTNIAPLLTPAEGPLTIGCGIEYGSFEHFNGRIDEVRIYNRALSGAEVQADREAPLQTPKQTPVAAYAFDEGEGETAEDVTGDGHPATLEGAEWTTHGRFGDALEFDASEGDAVTIPDSEDLRFEEFTLEAWVRPEAANTFMPAISKVSTGGYGYQLDAANEVARHPFGQITNHEYTGPYAYSPGMISSNAWTHLAVTNDGAHIRLYENGELVDERSSEALQTGEGDLQIGANTAWASPEYFDGRIDEVRLYNRALEPAEVAADESAPIQTPQQGPIAAYSFDEGEGTTVEDLTGNGHTGTIEGAEWARGKYGDALQFDGVEGCVSIPSSPELALTEELTLEAWVRPDGSGENAGPMITQEDPSAGEKEEPYAYEFLAGGEESPKAWTREAGSGYNGIYGTEPLPENAWSHIALTDNGARLRLYVDGELVRTIKAKPLTTGTGDLKIGCGPWGGAFEGRIDDIRVYNRALNEKEVRIDVTDPVVIDVVQTYETENSEGEQTYIRGTIHRDRLLLSIERLGKPDEEGAKGTGTALAAKPPPVMGRAYRFNECDYDFADNSEPGPKLYPVKKRVMEFMESVVEPNGTSPQCAEEREEPQGDFVSLTWAIVAHGVFHYRRGRLVWVDEKPKCNQWGPEEPYEYVHCEVIGNYSNEKIDIVGDWKWREGTYEPGVYLYHEACGRLDGVLSQNPPRQENTERVVHDSVHFYRWPSDGTDEPQTCNWKNPSQVYKVR